jgi:hypothetical protein
LRWSPWDDFGGHSLNFRLWPASIAALWATQVV